MTGRLKEADERTKRELADKCQENGWLRRGGYPWQDDPYLEEYPYEFAKAEQRGRAARLLRARKLGAAPGDRVRGSRLRAAGRRRRRVVDAEARPTPAGSPSRVGPSAASCRSPRGSHMRSSACIAQLQSSASASSTWRRFRASRMPPRRARDSIQQLNKTAMTPTRGARAELR